MTTLRDIAAAHRTQIIAADMGVAEAIVYIPATGDEVTGRGVWIENPSDELHPLGIGAESRTSSAILSIALALAPSLTRRDQFRRVATGETWRIDQAPLMTSVGYRIVLAKVNETTAKGLR